MSGKLLQRLVGIFFSFVALGGAQPRCDPRTEYQQDGECCLLCPPGSSMSSLGNCREPQCQKCEAGEYQDKYTREARCLPQRYCDPNKNFRPPVHDSRQRSQCVCREGFHCSSHSCLSCVPHTACTPGYGVKVRGSHSTDTVCEECSEGTFSSNKSHTEVCEKWTECPSGQKVVQSGTSRSDSVCGGQPRTHVGLIVLAVIFPVIVLSGLAWLIIRKTRLDRKTKSCFDLWPGEKKEEAPKENKPLVAPGDAPDESTERQVSRDEPRTPEEVDYELGQDISITTEVQFTDKGQFVMQDKGMKETKSGEEA